MEDKEIWEQLKDRFSLLSKVDPESAAGIEAAAIGQGWSAKRPLDFKEFQSNQARHGECKRRMLDMLKDNFPFTSMRSAEVFDKALSKIRIPIEEASGTSFHRWLDKACPIREDYSRVSRVASWHNPGPITELSDIFLVVDEGAGSNTDMPRDWWYAILEIVGLHFEGVVWLEFHE